MPFLGFHPIQKGVGVGEANQKKVGRPEDARDLGWLELLERVSLCVAAIQSPEVRRQRMLTLLKNTCYRPWLST
jgi:hypothetical protein